jgi:alpha-beta hydrolase superfamily lysophospholipase
MLTARLLSRLWPRLTLSTELEAAALSRLPEVVDAYRADPLVHDRASVRFGDEAFKAIDRIHQLAAEFVTPVLMIQGGRDRITLPDGGGELFPRLASSDKTRIVYPDAYHELHNDLQAGEVMETVTGWIEERLLP